MLEQAVLAEHFQVLLDQSRQAERAYAQLANQAQNPQVRQHLEQLLRDKQRHVALAERLIEIVY